VAGTPCVQVCLGSCTNSSYRDLMTVAAMLKGKTVHPRVSLTVTPGSKQVFSMIARSGGLADLIASGARILEAGCGPCIGMGQTPPTDGVTLRSFNRNFRGRTGSPTAQAYLCSPETCAAAALRGEITDPRDLGEAPAIEPPAEYVIDDNLIAGPSDDPASVEIVRGPNIKPCPTRGPVGDVVAGEVLLKVEDNITTDHIMPAGAKVLPLRSNIPAIANYVFAAVDPTFAERARKAGAGFVVGGLNYGQGSSREHAALAPMSLGVQGVLSKGFARIHRANLVNFGILPMEFAAATDYDRVRQGDRLEIRDVVASLKQNRGTLTVRNLTKNETFQVKLPLTRREADIILAGGLLNYTKGGAS
jgi:aconitate hydratase